MKIPLSVVFCLLNSLFIAFSVTTATLNCLNNNQDATYNRGDTAVVCVHFIPNNDETKAMRMSFQVVVDKYTAVQATGAYSAFQNYTALSSISLIVQADNNGTNSDNVTYMRTASASDVTSSNVVIPIFSLVINIDNGHVTSTSWDNGCWACTSLCYLDHISNITTQSNCMINPCNTTANSSTAACDPRIYVSWIGTDSSGDHMNSAGLRISRFRQYSIGDMYSSALSTYDNVLQGAQNEFNTQIAGNLNELLGGTTSTTTTISFSQIAFTNNGVIPSIYTRAGGNKNPGCSWTAVQGAQSYAFIMNHTNSSGTYHHFLLENIPSGFTVITDGSLDGGQAIVNSFNIAGYVGPEVTSAPNTYNFYLYALSAATINSTSISDFYANCALYSMGVGSFTGTYMNT